MLGHFRMDPKFFFSRRKVGDTYLELVQRFDAVEQGLI